MRILHGLPIPVKKPMPGFGLEVDFGQIKMYVSGSRKVWQGVFLGDYGEVPASFRC